MSGFLIDTNVLSEYNRPGGAVRNYRYVLKGDVRKYFPSIDHEILKSLVARAEYYFAASPN